MKIFVGFQAIGLGGFDQAIAGRAGPGASRGITKAISVKSHTILLVLSSVFGVAATVA